MTNIKINAIIKNITEDTSNACLADGQIDDNIIKYEEDKDTNVLLFLKMNIMELHRENKDIKMLLSFKEGETLDGYYELKTLALKIPAQTITKKLLIQKSEIMVKYSLILEKEKAGDFEYTIKYEE